MQQPELSMSRFITTARHGKSGIKPASMPLKYHVLFTPFHSNYLQLSGKSPQCPFALRALPVAIIRRQR
jgi:hypothetical protein